MDMLKAAMTEQELAEALRFVLGKTVQEIREEIDAADKKMQAKLAQSRFSLSSPLTEEELCKIESYCAYW